MAKTRVAILGMHRGGTSAIAGAIHGLGFFMGDKLLPASKTNKAGYFEDERVVDANNKIMGGNFYKPGLLYNPIAIDGLKTLLREEFDKHEMWAIKDPRLCYTLPFVIDAFPDIKIVSIYRHPWLSALSLSKRDNISFNVALEVSLGYLMRMIGNTEQVSTFRISFDDLLLSAKDSIMSLAMWLDVPYKQDALSAIDQSLATWELKLAKRYTFEYGVEFVK